MKNQNDRINRWGVKVFSGAIVIAAIFIIAFAFESPESFVVEVTLDNGEIIRKANIEKIYELFIDGIGAWGALIIGIIALVQGESSHRFAKELASRESSCNIFIENYTTLNMLNNMVKLKNRSAVAYEESDEHIYLTFKNFSNVFLKSIDIKFGDFVFHSSLTMVNGSAFNFAIYLPKAFSTASEDLCHIIFTSCNNVKTYGDFIVRQGSYNRKMIDQYHFYGIENQNSVNLD